MTIVKIGKILVISFIGFIITFSVGLGGNTVLKAGLPTSKLKIEVNFEKQMQMLEDELLTGKISRITFDSLSDEIRSQLSRKDVMDSDSHLLEKLPEWVSQLGISKPQGMKFDKAFSDFTSVENPSEGFNSVTLVYFGTYEKAVEEATRIARDANLAFGVDFKAKGSPERKSSVSNEKSGISFLNYNLGDTKKDFLISVKVEPSGRLTITVTDNKQLNDCLSAYAPLNNRQNSHSKQKKQ